MGGRDFSYAPPPLSITSQGEYIGGTTANIGRSVDRTKFILTKEGETKDFVRFIDRNANAPRIMCVLSEHRDIKKLTANEVVGPQWSSGAATLLNSSQASLALTPQEDYVARRAEAKKNKMRGKEPPAAPVPAPQEN